ncbi:MAG: pentapeptide repeat-containing protein, partial [Myxococcota bacterium]|nr:pentapeptide repeat-containing protein [Myxococcota bacterium]
GADISGADLSSLDLSGVDFSGANLSSASLNNTNLTGSTLTGADFTGTDLSTATLTGVVRPALADCPNALPDGWWCDAVDTASHLWGPGVNYSNYDFGNKTFVMTQPDKHFPLAGVKLNGSSNVTLKAQDCQGFNASQLDAEDSDNISIISINSSSVLDFSGSTFDAAENLTLDFAAATAGKAPNVNLIGADFTDVTGLMLETHGGPGDWTGADFTGADIHKLAIEQEYTDTNEQTIIENVSFNSATFNTSPNADEYSGNFFFEGAQLKNVTFINATMNCEVVVQGTQNSGKFGPNTTLDTVNFTGASLNFAVFKGMDLTLATFTNANLTNAILKESDLTGLSFSGTNLTDVVWSDAICPDGVLENQNSCCDQLIDSSIVQACPLGGQ